MEPIQRHDVTLACRECGDAFVYTVDDQVYFEQKAFAQPQRCRDCRKARRELTRKAETSHGR